MSSRIAFVTFNRLALAVACASAAMGAVAAPGADSAYMTDPQFSFVEDATSRGIGQVNMITCFISSMAPDQLVNQGNYVAMVDMAKCDPNSRSSASNSGSTNSGAQAADYMTSIVNSSRASNDEPMITRVWVNEDMGDEGSGTIYVRSEATEAPSDSNPYGAFRLDFCGRGDGEMFNFGCMMKGFIQASSSGITFFQDEGDGEFSHTTALQMTASSTTAGSGRLYMLEQGGDGSNEQEFSFAYNATHFLRGDQCFSRDATEADMSVWRYGVYNADTGARVELNSGFPIEYTPTGGSRTYHGYLGYHGLHLPSEAMSALAQEQNPQVQRVEYQPNAEPLRVAYDVVQNGGKLTRYSKQTRTLDQIDKVKFSVFVNDSASEFFTGAQDFNQYEAYWDETSGSIKVTGSFMCNQNGCQTQNFDTEQTGNVAYFATRGGLRGWSQSLGGDLFINFAGVGDSIDSSTIQVVYRTQDLVYPSAMAALGSLYCLNDCPTAASIESYLGQTQQAPVQSPMLLANNWMPTAADNVISYNSSNGVLVDAQAAEVVMTDANALQMFPQYNQGIRSGRLVTDLAAVECNEAPGSYCDYKAFDLDEYYVWETGHNAWNQFAAVKDAEGAFVEFDAPWQFSYTVPQGARYGQFAGQNIVLEYGGFGNLWGIPGHCVSHLTNAPVSCDTDNARYVPAFAIPGGAQVTRGNTGYLVKWLDREIRFARKDAADCAALSVPGAGDVTLPTVTDFHDPSDSSNADYYIGAKPEIDAAPRVIHGEVKF